MSNKIQKVEISAKSIKPEKMYLWRRPSGEITPVWRKNGDVHYLEEHDDAWEIAKIKGELFGPIELSDE